MSPFKEPEDLRISISGVRGIVGRSFTDALVTSFAQAFTHFVSAGKVLVAQDTRPTGSHFRNLIIRKLRQAGVSVIDIGVAPTPTMLLMVRHLKARGGIIVTASHNPAGWNGLKFVGSDGQFLDTRQMERLIRLRSQKRSSSQTHRKGSFRRDDSALTRYLSHILRHLDLPKIRSCHFRVAIDPCNGTGAVATRRFLERLGCKVFAMNNVPNGRFAHPPEPTKEHLSDLARFVCQKKADIGFAQDPDADRLTIVTDRGKPLNGEYTLVLAVQHILSRKKTAVVVNLSTSRMIESIVRRKGMKIYYSKIGERHVVEKMRKLKASIGGEGNGGVIYPAINAARDSFVGMGLILESLARSPKPLSAIIRGLPRYEMIQKKLTLSKARTEALLLSLPKRFKGGKVNRLDGIRIDTQEGWIHARPSNTEPVLRLIAEASSRQKAQQLLDRLL